jgi:hypothetical protein
VADVIAGILKWASDLIGDLVSGRKSVDEVRAICLAQGVEITETDSDKELAELLKESGG